jgi:hypothetical protein
MIVHNSALFRFVCDLPFLVLNWCCLGLPCLASHCVAALFLVLVSVEPPPALILLGVFLFCIWICLLSFLFGIP